MSKINIKDANNAIIDVEFIRYFKHKETSYFIYTQNELDEKEFVKLYIVKIMKQLGEFVAKTIKDEEEWKQIQLIVKKFVKEIKDNNIQHFFDLDRSDIVNIKIKEARFFKLDKKLMGLLKKDVNNTNVNVDISNINLEELPSMDEIAPVKIEKNEADVENYKDLYTELQKDNEELNEVMSDMLLELSEYRTKYGDIKEGE